jgi:hypothetical protein
MEIKINRSENTSGSHNSCDGKKDEDLIKLKRVFIEIETEPIEKWIDHSE